PRARLLPPPLVAPLQLAAGPARRAPSRRRAVRLPHDVGVGSGPDGDDGGAALRAARSGPRALPLRGLHGRSRVRRRRLRRPLPGTRGAGLLSVVHELPLERRTLHGHFSRDLEPVLAVDAGDSGRVAVPNAVWGLDSGGEFPPRGGTPPPGHALAGPIEVRGARAGQTLVVRIDEVRPGPWGVTFGHPSLRLQWELEGELGRTGGRTVRLAPFLGVL